MWLLYLASVGAAVALGQPGLAPDAPREGESADVAEEPSAPAGEIEMDAETQALVGLRTAPVEAATLTPHRRAFGLVVQDPARSFTLRAPLAGRLETTESWPALGDELGVNQQVGSILPQLGPLDRLGAMSQRIEAEAAVRESEASLAAARASFTSKRALNTEGRMVSDRSVEEAEAAVRAAEARLAAAQQKLALFVAAVGEEPGLAALLPLQVSAGGLVTEVGASPGEFVDAGQTLLRVVSLDRVLVHLALPLGANWDSSVRQVRVTASGDEERVFDATVLGPLATADDLTKGPSWLLSVEAPEGALRPGAPVTVQLPLGGPPRAGVIVPREAFVRYAGGVWVFVQGDETTFERREVSLEAPTPAGWFVTRGVHGGEHVVTSAAQVLLSEQLRGQIEQEEEAAE